MAGIKIGIELELESDFKEFAQALGLADLRSEPSSAAGGLELMHITIVDLHGLHLSAQYAWAPSSVGQWLEVNSSSYSTKARASNPPRMSYPS
jgi:hypothetical protein